MNIVDHTNKFKCNDCCKWVENSLIHISLITNKKTGRCEKCFLQTKEYDTKNRTIIREQAKVRRHTTYNKRFKEMLNKRQSKITGTPKTRFNTYKGNAKYRKIEFGLSYEEFMSFWQKPCSSCNDILYTVGLDRVDSKRGFFMDNIIPGCHRCNVMKNKYPQDDFINQCRKIVNNFKQ
jgi:hypothetical protein